MNEYKGLRYKTKGAASPQGRPRVYFCAHSDDFDIFFESIVKEIQDIQFNAAIWYYDPKEDIPDNENFYADLSQMQLFVIPVTAHFIYTDNHARTKEFSYAIENHIPVLPLMQEPGLENDFNRICGDLQFLDKYALRDDPTAIPYEEKLKKFLESVLVSDELAKRIREAFDAYIFLSYRKKDRKYAQSIMRLIHDNEFARDIAIWYDEFLTPGENFNNAIEEAMKKSRLFALVVTPHLLENPNYVLTVEYPEAKKTGKPILPIEGYPTDREALKELYESIDPTLTSEEVAERLLEIVKDIAYQENDKDPAHLFLIGLAYLSGIDVEVDHGKALELITRAAKSDLPEAYEKLVSMYQNGEGVERNYDTAIEWQARYVEHLRHDYEQNPSEPSLNNLIRKIWNLGDYQRATGKIQSAKESFLMMFEYAKECYEKFKTEQRMISISLNRLGMISKDEKKLNEAKVWFLKSYEIYQDIVKENSSKQARRDLSVTCNNLGDICKAEKKLNEAKTWYLRAYDACLEIAKESDTVKSRRDLSICCNKTGDICKAEGNLKEAKEWYLKAYELRQSIVEEIDTVESRQDLSLSCNKLGDISKAEKDLDDAKEWYLTAYEIRKRIVMETNTLQSRRDLAFSCNKSGDIAKTRGNLTEAKVWYEKAYEIRLDIAEQTNTPDALRNLSTSCNKLGGVYETDGNLQTAREWYLKAYNIRLKIANETNTIDSRRDLSISCNNLGDIDQKLGDIVQAKTWYLSAYSIRQSIINERNTVQARRDLSASLQRMGEITEMEGNYSKAKEWYLQSIEIREQIADKTKTMQSYEDLAVSCSKLAKLPQDVSEPERRKYIEEYYRLSKILFASADIPKYREFMKEAEMFIKTISV